MTHRTHTDTQKDGGRNPAVLFILPYLRFYRLSEETHTECARIAYTAFYAVTRAYTQRSLATYHATPSDSLLRSRNIRSYAFAVSGHGVRAPPLLL